MTKFFIKRFQYKPDPKTNELVKKFQVLTCKSNLLPDHKSITIEAARL